MSSPKRNTGTVLIQLMHENRPYESLMPAKVGFFDFFACLEFGGGA